MKLYFGNAITTATTLMILVLLGFISWSVRNRTSIQYWVQQAAKEHGIPFNAIHITDKESAQNVPTPVTTYALFRDGQFLTQSIQSDKNQEVVEDIGSCQKRSI